MTRTPPAFRSSCCSVLKQKDLALMLGATAFVQKPLTESALVALLEALDRG